MKYTFEDQIVLISGGSQGLGKQFATKYYTSSDRSKIIIISRSETKLKNAIRDIVITDDVTDYNPVRLEQDTPQTTIESHRLFYIPCDLSHYNSTAQVFHILSSVNLLPTHVISCAGGSTPKLFRDLTGHELEMGVRANYLTALYLAHQVAITVPTAHLIIVSSATAFFPFIGYSQYAPLKASLKALVGILRHELPKARISCVYPGNFQSEGFETEELTKPAITKEIEGPSLPISTERCCDIIVWWLKMGYDDITTDFIGWVLMSLDMGLNKSDNKSFLWVLQIALGAFANLVLVPLYMVVCRFQIRRWARNEQRKQRKET